MEHGIFNHGHMARAQGIRRVPFGNTGSLVEAVLAWELGSHNRGKNQRAFGMKRASMRTPDKVLTEYGRGRIRPPNASEASKVTFLPSSHAPYPSPNNFNCVQFTGARVLFSRVSLWRHRDFLGVPRTVPNLMLDRYVAATEQRQAIYPYVTSTWYLILGTPCSYCDQC